MRPCTKQGGGWGGGDEIASSGSVWQHLIGKDVNEKGAVLTWTAWRPIG